MGRGGQPGVSALTELPSLRGPSALKAPEKTGVAALDTLIEQFRDNDPELYQGTRLSMMTDQDLSAGECATVAHEFEKFLKQHGFKPEDPRETFELPDEWGYTDRILAGCEFHDVTSLEHNGRKYSIDWTAAQYGYREFPLVQQWDAADQTWRRDFLTD